MHFQATGISFKVRSTYSIFISRVILALAFLLILLGSVRSASAQAESVLYTFSSCCQPETSVVIDKDGNLYGTYLGTGNGAVYKLTPGGAYSTLYAFGNYPDGYWPWSLVIDQQGNLFGTTLLGGSQDGGIIFEIAPDGTETILYNFTCGSDGCNPQAGLSMDSQGNFYGTTTYGGSASFYGTVFKFVISSRTLTTLYSFSGGADGCLPWGVVLGNDGDLYGATEGCGVGQGDAYGLVYKLNPSTGVETVLHHFDSNGKDGFYPKAGVVLDSQRNSYGTTQWGGKVGIGTVYKISPSGREIILHSFAGGTDGFFPQSTLTLDSNGNLYGTTFYGGAFDSGTVFKFARTKETILHSFAPNGIDGFAPSAGVTFDADGNLYGTTAEGGPLPACLGYGCGIVFKITPQVLPVTTNAPLK